MFFRDEDHLVFYHHSSFRCTYLVIFVYDIMLTDLSEKVYMEQPLGFVSEEESSGLVCHFCISLYGLKQSLEFGLENFVMLFNYLV